MVTFEDLVDYCFGELSGKDKFRVFQKICSDENYQYMVRGINLAKKEGLTKQQVLDHF